MKAVYVTRYGGPDVLEIQEAPIPEPGPDQVLVRVRCIGLNFADIVGRFGAYPGTPKPPYIPGLEFSGDVVRIGPKVTKFSGRERIMGYSKLGSHAEYVLVNQYYATLIPEKMTYEEGASFLVSMLSAYHGLVRLANLRTGERLLVHAAAGGVGLACLQIGRHLNAEVFATAGTDEKTEVARSFGAHHVINYTTSAFEKEIERLTGGYGVDVVMDSVGGEVFKKSWHLLAPMGRYLMLGVSSMTTADGNLTRTMIADAYEQMKPIFPPSLIHTNKGIFGFNLGLITGRERYFEQAATELLTWYKLGVIRPLVGKVFPFGQIVEAHRYLQNRQSIGKVVVSIPT
ncbi:MAG: Synaptic vesicle rane protein [Bacteroidetes bacterium]|nr:Synaptic vesicle rane protein [Bacteroidota bacterium]